jgi:hypothetical protein
MMSGRILTALLALSISSAGITSTSDLRAAASALLASFDSTQRESASYDLEDDIRATWSNLPTLMAPPAGILLGNLDDDQRGLVHDLLRASLSSQGYGKSVAIMWLDDVLHEQETQRLNDDPEARDNPMAAAMAENRDSGNYAVALFGDPDDKQWGWKITGHHLALNITVQGDGVAFTPIFLGSNPMVIREGRYAGWSALPFEGRRGHELMASLTDEQRSTALVSTELPGDVIEGPGRRESLKDFEGLSVKELSSTQLSLLQLLVGEYLRNAEPSAAGRQLDELASAGWDSLWFSWRGPVALEGQFYYRIHGPRLLIEYHRQNANHDHAVVRDPTNDYGEDWLGHHYREFHPTMEQIRKDLRTRLGTP